jgi:hypothetical protein
MAQAGQLGQPVPIRGHNGSMRCGECNVITKRNGAPGFQFRFHKNAVCGIGPGGCPALAAGGGANINQYPISQGMVQLPSRVGAGF